MTLTLSIPKEPGFFVIVKDGNQILEMKPRGPLNPMIEGFVGEVIPDYDDPEGTIVHLDYSYRSIYDGIVSQKQFSAFFWISSSSFVCCDII